MANGFGSERGADSLYQDMAELRKAAEAMRADGKLSAPKAQTFNASQISKIGFFAEKPLTRDNSPKPETKEPPKEEPVKNSSPSNFYDWLFESYKRMEKGDAAGAWQAALKTLEYDTTEPDLFVPLCQQFDPTKRRQLANSAMKKTPPECDAYQYLWVEVALSYWYEGNFKECCEEYETILKQKYLDPRLIPMLYNSLAMCYEALGRYKEAEEKYLAIDNRESVIKSRARSGDIEGAVTMMDKGMGLSEPIVNDALKETLLCCLGRPSDKIVEHICALLELDSDWPYKDFMLGVMEIVASQGAVGYSRLERFLNICNSSEHEWAITLRWEVGVTNDVLGGFGA